MTTTTIPVRLDFDSVSPTFARVLTHLGNAATAEADRAQIDPRLRELLRLRTSQLNGCAYCVDMHTQDALAIGEEPERLAALPVWPESRAGPGGDRQRPERGRGEHPGLGAGLLPALTRTSTDNRR